LLVPEEAAVIIDRRKWLAAAGGAAAGACLGQARHAVRAAEAPSGGEWISLFDGKTLTGWHKNPEKIGHGTGGRWSVEPDGVLAGEQEPPGSGNGGILLTDRKFGSFELALELKPTWGVDSGVFLRCTDRGQCYQMMVDYYDNGSIGQLYGEAIGGWGARAFSLKGIVEDGRLVRLETTQARPEQAAALAYSCRPEEWVEAWKIDDWNAALIRVEGGPLPRITTHINDLMVCEFDAATTSAANFDGEEIAQTLGAEGSIAVQVHGGGSYPAGAKCRWRNIKIRTL
jgi:hypothetical protein